MKRIWIRAATAAALCAALLSSCTFGGESASEHVPVDPLTGQELQYPGERTAAIVIDNAPGSTVQWGIGSASIVLEAQTAADAPTSLCLVYPAVSSMPHRPRHAGAGSLLAPAQRSGSDPHPARQQSVCPQLS